METVQFYHGSTTALPADDLADRQSGPIVLMLALSKEIWQAHLVNTLHILQTFFSLQRRSKNFSHHSKKKPHLITPQRRFAC